jgi:hypothetical protein
VHWIRRDERGFTRIWQSQQTNVCQHFQFETQFTTFTLFTFGTLTWGAIGRGFEVDISPPTFTTFNQLHLLTMLGQVSDHFVCVTVCD